MKNETTTLTNGDTPQLTAGVFIFGKFAFVRRDNLNPKKELAPPGLLEKVFTAES